MHGIAPSPSVPRLRFGLFELDPAGEELRKSGVKVRIQGQPLRILLYLAQHPGEIVSREELHRTFWKPDTTVDLERSLAAAIHKIRECLNDSVTSPRFVETVSRSGYRFIAPVAELLPEVPRIPVPATDFAPVSRPAEPASAAATPTTGTSVSSRSGLARWPWRRLFIWSVLAVVAASIVVLFRFPAGSAATPAIRAITHNASVSLSDEMSQGFPGAVTDNARIYFPRSEDGRHVLAVVMLNGGDTTAITLPEELGSPVADDVSPDGLRLLLRDRLSTASEQPLWVASPAGQTARQVPSVSAHDSAWMPDGDTILYANGNALYTVHDNGSANAAFASLPGRPFRMRWSPDGKRLRLTLRDDRTLATSLWELRADGSGAHRIFAGWHQDEAVCCGVFLNAGDLYVFQAGGERDGSLWAAPVQSDWLGRQREPFRLAEGPLSYSSPAAKRSGRGIVFAGMASSFHLLRWSSPDGSLVPAPEFLNDAARVEFSPDGHWVSWVRRDDASVWRSRLDGSDRVRMLGAPYEAFIMAWSPDATRLAVMARRPGSPWRILIADVNSGHTEELLPEDPHNQADPQWVSDGAEVVFGRLPQRLAEPALPPSLFRVDLATRKAVEVPGSAGLFSPRVSPDGRTLLALNASQTAMRQLDLATGIWTTAAQGHFDDPHFQADSRAVMFRDFAAAGLTLFRLDLTSHRMVPFAEGLRTGTTLSQPLFAGLLAGNTPVVSAARDGADLYELEVPE
jgi:DNA-binding winged helix-turn-helix (wHTH) protein/Tol biopolymer transport system component